MIETERPGVIPSERTLLLQEADRLVNKHRNKDYGPPENSFENIARFWRAYFAALGVVMLDRKDNSFEIEAIHVGPMMRLLKEAGLCDAPAHKDSLVDIAGYAACDGEIRGVFREDVEKLRYPMPHTPPEQS